MIICICSLYTYILYMLQLRSCPSTIMFLFGLFTFPDEYIPLGTHWNELKILQQRRVQEEEEDRKQRSVSYQICSVHICTPDSSGSGKKFRLRIHSTGAKEQKLNLNCRFLSEQSRRAKTTRYTLTLVFNIDADAVTTTFPKMTLICVNSILKLNGSFSSPSSTLPPSHTSSLIRIGTDHFFIYLYNIRKNVPFQNCILFVNQLLRQSLCFFVVFLRKVSRIIQNNDDI